MAECETNFQIEVTDAAAFRSFLAEYRKENADRQPGAFYHLVTPSFDVSFPPWTITSPYYDNHLEWVIVERSTGRLVGRMTTPRFRQRTIDYSGTDACTQLFSLPSLIERKLDEGEAKLAHGGL